MEELVAIARIVKTRGIKGEVVAELLTDFPERFEGLTKVIGGARATAKRADLKIEDHWFQKDRIVLKFAGFDSIEDSGRLAKRRDLRAGIRGGRAGRRRVFRLAARGLQC